jgi:DegV family protein with EDD domain
MDSRMATVGQGLLVQEAVELRAKGHPLAEIHRRLERHSDHLQILFMLDDPQYLRAGGRAEEALSFLKKFISLLKIKPVLHVDRLCAIKLHSVSRSRQQAIKQMLAYVKATIDTGIPRTIHVVQADAQRLATMLTEAIRTTFGEGQAVSLHEVPPVIGAHVGPGTVALVFECAKPRP